MKETTDPGVSNKWFPLPATLLALVLGGCASSARLIDIDSKPTGASIYVNGEKKGTTRDKVRVDFKSAGRVMVQIVKARYKPLFQYWTLEEIPDEDAKKMFTLEPD